MPTVEATLPPPSPPHCDHLRLHPFAACLMQESLAEYIIFWDDDIKPSSDCLAAYVEAFQKHPQVGRFYSECLSL